MKRTRNRSKRSIVTLAPDAPLRLADALKGVMVFGSTGSGKTSGSGAFLARAYVNCAPEDGEGDLSPESGTGNGGSRP